MKFYYGSSSSANVYDKNRIRLSLDSLLAGPNKLVWNKGLSNKWGKLAQVNAHGVKLTDTIDFIARSEVPASQPITYASFVLDDRPLKEEPYRIWTTAGGDKL